MGPYIIIMYFLKYNANPKTFLNTILWIVWICIILDVYFVSYLLGQDYIFQMVIGQAAALVYLVLCLTFDTELQKFCENTGFILRKSRGNKFKVFFFVLVLFTGIVMFYYSLTGTWTMPQDWIVNANLGVETCTQAFTLQASNNLGLNGTFEKSSILFVLLGIVFG